MWFIRRKSKENMVKRHIKELCFILSLIGMMIFSGCSNQQAVETANEVIEKSEQENRIIALSVSLVDILAELDIEMVGVPNSQYTLNEKAQGVTQVGLSMSPDVELIASLNPTHVLSVTTLKSMVGEKFELAGIEPTYLNLENIDTLKESITQIGQLFNKEEEAAQLVAEFENDIDTTIKSVKGKESPKVLILFGFPGNYLEGTSECFVGQMVELLGGHNVVSETNEAYVSVNLEALLVEQPDVILRLTHGVKDDVIEMFEKEFRENPIWSQFDAVKNEKVYDLDDSLFNVSASLDTAEALSQLAEIIYE